MTTLNLDLQQTEGPILIGVMEPSGAIILLEQAASKTYNREVTLTALPASLFVINLSSGELLARSTTAASSFPPVVIPAMGYPDLTSLYLTEQYRVLGPRVPPESRRQRAFTVLFVLIMVMTIIWLRRSKRKKPSKNEGKPDAPNFITVITLIVALSSAYFMISAWDDYLDHLIRTYFGITKESLNDTGLRAVIATVFALAILGTLNIHIDDIFGVVWD